VDLLYLSRIQQFPVGSKSWEGSGGGGLVRIAVNFQQPALEAGSHFKSKVIGLFTPLGLLIEILPGSLSAFVYHIHLY